MDYSLKQRIYLSGIPRRILSQRLDILYTTFNSKLNGFSRFSEQEEKALEKILSDQEAVREAESEKDAPYYAR
jgi:hypothetical protein